MREIKFRAWDENHKRMVPNSELQIQSLPDFKPVPLNDGIFLLGLSYELMQYTGLKDKNGKEIYEGDIIDNERGGYQGVVEFCGGAFIHRNDPLGFYVEDGEIQGSRLEMLDTSTWAIIIGNIHENPELLK